MLTHVQFVESRSAIHAAMHVHSVGLVFLALLSCEAVVLRLVLVAPSAVDDASTLVLLAELVGLIVAE